MGSVQATSEQSHNHALSNSLSLHLLTIRGTLAPATLEAARTVHNQTAGAPANVAAAQSLGDLSHMVYVPAGQPTPGVGDFLILDLWNSMDGLNQFFANPQVQHQAGLIFSQRDPVVWVPADGFTTYHFPAPYGQNERIIAAVHGPVRSWEEARETHNALVAQGVSGARRAGDLSHEVYRRLAPPNTPEAMEFFAVDVWTNAAGMGAYYQNPEFLSSFQKLFAGPPSTSTWIHPSGEWVEW